MNAPVILVATGRRAKRERIFLWYPNGDTALRAAHYLCSILHHLCSAQIAFKRGPPATVAVLPQPEPAGLAPHFITDLSSLTISRRINVGPILLVGLCASLGLFAMFHMRTAAAGASSLADAVAPQPNLADKLSDAVANAANAEETASAAEQLSAQSEELRSAAAGLAVLLGLHLEVDSTSPTHDQIEAPAVPVHPPTGRPAIASGRRPPLKSRNGKVDAELTFVG